MAKEILTIPEQYLADVIKVIRLGLKHGEDRVDPVVIEQLTKWCDEEEKYLGRFTEDITNEN